MYPQITCVHDFKLIISKYMFMDLPKNVISEFLFTLYGLPIQSKDQPNYMYGIPTCRYKLWAAEITNAEVN